MDSFESGEERLLVRASIGNDAGDLAVQIENEVMLLHAGKDRVEGVK